MVQHTPGPWKAADTGMDWRIEITAEGKSIAAAFKAPFLPEGQALENAKLLAAAPEIADERDRLKSVNANLRETLRGLTSLCLEMGHTIRSLDESGDHHEEWTNDGEYIPDDRFSAASAALSNTLDYTNSLTLLNALRSVIEWTDNENNTPPDLEVSLIRNCARAAIQGQSTQDSMALRKGMIAEAASLCEEDILSENPEYLRGMVELIAYSTPAGIEDELPSDRVADIESQILSLVKTAEPVEKLKGYRVTLHEDPGDQFKVHFDCLAEDDDHAAEQAENAYPGCEVIHTCRFNEEHQEKEAAASFPAPGC